jgi:Zn-dependent metalloprotease
MLLRRKTASALLIAGALATSTPAGATPESTPTRALISAFGKDLRVTYTPGTSVPRSLTNLSEKTVGTTSAERAASFLSRSRALLGLSHLEARVLETRAAAAGDVVRFALFAGGLEVQDRTLTVKLDAEGRVRTLRSDAVPFTLPQIRAELPSTAAVAAVKARYQVAAAGAPTKVVLAHAADHARVAWRVPVAVIPLQAHFYVWVDAEDGTILREAPAGFDQPLKRIPLRSKEASK